MPDHNAHDHIVTSFEQELKLLAHKIAEMGGLAEKQVADSVACLLKRDISLAEAVIGLDSRLDVMQRTIEELAILTIAKRQPLAVDLREIIATIRISNDLERIGDLAKNIGKRVIALNGDYQFGQLLRGVSHMADLAMQQLRDVLDAYVRRDGVSALEVWKADGAVDALYTSLFRELLTYMMEDPRNISPCTHLLFAAKNIERIGDHATNIAETVHYLVTGEMLADARPKSDTSSLTTVDYPK